MLLSRILSIRCCRNAEGKFTIRFWALLTENHVSEFLAKALNLVRIRCRSKALGKFEEGLLLLLFCLETFFDEFNEHSICTEATAFCHAADLGRYLRGERHALAYSFLFGCHDTIMHQSGA